MWKSVNFLLQFLIFLKFKLNFLFCGRKWASEVKYFWSYWLQKMCLFNCITVVVFSKPFRSDRLNDSQKLLKSAEKYFYPTFPSFWPKLSYKKLFLIRSEILGLLVNTLNAKYGYSGSNRENLALPIQLQLCEKV